MGSFNANLTPLGIPGQSQSQESKASADDQSSSKDTRSQAKIAEWERKQRLREYRVASRREKRTRKADEKKQRKLNATILRRMTKNPEKYNKNAERNRRRDIEEERTKIREGAVRQVERLAAEHDPSGKTFNVGEVRKTEDGKVVNVEKERERKRKWEERMREREAEAEAGENGVATDGVDDEVKTEPVKQEEPPSFHNGINPARLQMMDIDSQHTQLPTRNGTTSATLLKGQLPLPPPLAPVRLVSKTQQRKAAASALARPPPPMPTIPSHVTYPPEGEEDLLSLWNLTDADLERRVLHTKKAKATARKDLRSRQQAGKKERRAARDEKRRVYRDEKKNWKEIKEKEKEYKRRIERIEQEEAKRISTEVNRAQRQAALAVCSGLGFTLDNVPGVAEVVPRVSGMKGQEVDFSILEAGAKTSQLKVLTKPEAKKANSRRVDLGRVADESQTRLVNAHAPEVSSGDNGDFLSLGATDEKDKDFEALNYNHRLRRKLNRAMEAAAISKEILVRQACVAHLTKLAIEAPEELKTPPKPQEMKGRLVLGDGRLETDKQERMRWKMELLEYNRVAKVLRAQAKKRAIEAGLRKYAELTGGGVMEAKDLGRGDE